MDRYRFRVANKHSFASIGDVSNDLEASLDSVKHFIVVYTVTNPDVPLFAIFDDFELQIFKNAVNKGNSEGSPHVFTYRTKMIEEHSYNFLVSESEFMMTDHVIHVGMDGQEVGYSGCLQSSSLKESLQSWAPAPEYYCFFMTIADDSVYVSRVDHLHALFGSGLKSHSIQVYIGSDFLCTLHNKEQIDLFMNRAATDNYRYLSLDLRGNKCQPYSMEDSKEKFIVPSTVLVLNNRHVIRKGTFNSYYEYVSWREAYERTSWRDSKYEFRVYRYGIEKPVATHRFLTDFSVSMADFLIEVRSILDKALICTLKSRKDVELAKKNIVQNSDKDYWLVQSEQAIEIPTLFSEFKSPAYIFSVDRSGTCACEGYFNTAVEMLNKLVSLSIIKKPEPVVKSSRYTYIITNIETDCVIYTADTVALKGVDYNTQRVNIYPKGGNKLLFTVCSEADRALAELYINEELDENVWRYYHGSLIDPSLPFNKNSCYSVSVERDGFMRECWAVGVTWDPHQEQRESTESNKQHNCVYKAGARYRYLVQLKNEFKWCGQWAKHEELDKINFDEKYVVVVPQHEPKTAVYLLNCADDVDNFKRHIEGVMGIHYWARCKGKGHYLHASEINEKTFEPPVRLFGVGEEGTLVEDRTLIDYVAFRIFFDTSVPEHTPVSPKHYKNFFREFEWLEVMSESPTMKEHFEVALELQVRKYLDRRGQKDEDVQELKKGLVYFLCMIQFIEHGKFDLKNIHLLVEKV
jgi:hypothetical protein